MPRKPQPAEAENRALRSALRKIVTLCRQSRARFGGNAGQLRALRFTIEDNARTALGKPKPWTD